MPRRTGRPRAAKVAYLSSIFRPSECAFNAKRRRWRIREPQTLRAQLLPEDEVLFDQVVDPRLLSPLEGACAHGNQELERAPRHLRVKIRLVSIKFIRRTPLASPSNRRIPFKIYLDLISAPYAVVNGKPGPIAYDNRRSVNSMGRAGGLKA